MTVSALTPELASLCVGGGLPFDLRSVVTRDQLRDCLRPGLPPDELYKAYGTLLVKNLVSGKKAGKKGCGDAGMKSINKSVMKPAYHPQKLFKSLKVAKRLRAQAALGEQVDDAVGLAFWDEPEVA